MWKTRTRQALRCRSDVFSHQGPEGNIEFLGYLAKQGEEHIPDLAEVVRQAHEELDAKA